MASGLRHSSRQIELNLLRWHWRGRGRSGGEFVATEPYLAGLFGEQKCHESYLDHVSGIKLALNWLE